jgi:osmotically-inducible protein OsmY
MLIHSPAGIDPTNPLSIEIRELQKKKKALGRKQDTSHIEAEILKKQFILGTYWDEEEHKFYFPTDNLEAAIKAGAQKSKLGKQAEAGIRVETESGFIYLEGFSHAKTLEKVYDDEVKKKDGMVFKCPVRIPPRTGSRVMSHRMQIPTKSTFEADLIVDTDIIAEKDAEQAAIAGGLYSGLGVWRPKFGRFTIEFLSRKDYSLSDE